MPNTFPEAPLSPDSPDVPPSPTVPPSFFQQLFHPSLGLPPKPAPGQTEADSVKGFLLARGWTELNAEKQAQKVAATMLAAPKDWFDVVGLGARMAIPFLVARYVPGGGGLVQVGKQVGTNIFGQAAVGGLTRAAQTGDPSEAVGGAAQAGIEAIPGAVLQGAVGLSTGPSKATVRAQQAIRYFQGGFSPEVGKHLDVTNPRELGSIQLVNRMMKTAGKKLNAMEATISDALGNTRFNIPLEKPAGSSVAPAPPLFGPSGSRITDPSLIQMIGGAQRGSQAIPEPPGSSFIEVRNRIKSLREGAYTTPQARLAARRQANFLNNKLLAEMQSKGFSDLADQYHQALTRHAKDMVGIRGLKWFRDQQLRPGGASPVDDPQLSDAMDQLTSKGLGQQARLMLAGAFAAMRHPFLAAGEAIQAAKQIGRVVDVRKIKGPFTPNVFQQLAPPAAGAAATGFFGGRGLQTGTGVESLNPALEDLSQAEQEIGVTDSHLGDLDQAIKDLP